MLSRLAEVYQYRELLKNFVIKDLKVKYKNTALGFFWSLLQPLLMMAVFTFIFSIMFRANVENYPIFFLTAFLPWNFFSVTLMTASNSLVGNASLIKKIYFPREIIPFSIVVSNLITFLLSLALLLVVLVFYGYKFYAFLPILLLIIVLQVLMLTGFSLMLAIVNVYFRDVQQLIGILLMVWMYATPIIYDMTMIPERFQPLVKYVNPLTSIVFLYRNSLYWASWPSLKLLAYAVLVSVLTFVAGYLLFLKYVRSFVKEL